LDFAISFDIRHSALFAMTSARLQAIKKIFHGALDCEAEDVSAFLERACEGDAALRHEVEAFLIAHQQAGNFIEAPIASLAATIIDKEQTELLIGQTIGHYKISKRIGAGGMGEVYLASDITAGRNAALKLLPPHLTSDADRLKRFQQEARAVAGLNHPNIVTIYEVGADNSTPYIATELIESETLRQRLGRGSIQVNEAVEIAIQVAGALAAAHSAGVVHRDIKPENIMLRPDGYVKVLDFGIAKLAEQEVPATMAEEEALLLVETNLGSILGTVRYMSPEQARGASVDKRTDIWSLGAVLYEMATGHAPFTGDTSAEVMATILAKEPPPLSNYMVQTPGELQQIVSKALRKDPDQRYQNAKEMLEALKDLRHKLEFTAELERAVAVPLWLRWARWPAALALTLLAGALAVALFYWLRNPSMSSIPEKSIAVLPFENLSNDKGDVSFTDGLQDDVLTKLAKIADLKVISRTSVMQYRGKQNTREIGNALRVSHVLEGSARKTGDRFHINAQLIDTRTDTHVWAEDYDRDLNDVFAIQSEIAQKVAEQLHAKISSAERLAVQRPPTGDLTAFDLYSRAKNLILDTSLGSEAKTNFLQAVELLNRAVARDPSFFDAYCQLAYAHDAIYFAGYDHTPARLTLAEAAIQIAFRLRPNAGEAHLARALNLYWGYLDYDGALGELEIMRQTQPNDPRLFKWKGTIQRRQGHWEESTRNLERALDLDPRNVSTLQQIALSYEYLRRYAEEKRMLDRVLAIAPNDVESKAERAVVEFNWQADSRPLRQTIDSIQATNPVAMSKIADARLICALGERDAAAAKNTLAGFGENRPHLTTDNVPLTRLFLEGVIARMAKDDDKARSAFTAARAEQEKTVQAQPNYAPALCVLGLIDAGLGHKEEALRQGRRAVELLPVEKDAINGPAMIKYLAMIAAWVGDKDFACEQLATAIRFPNSPSYGQLKLLPFWDPLRGDPRFEKIVASLAPNG
jgi:serine/threonine protein kinase/Tfp pilus assembly protein PilF